MTIQLTSASTRAALASIVLTVAAGAAQAQVSAPLSINDPAITSPPLLPNPPPMPKYPDSSRHNQEDGVVGLTACISKEGRATSAEIVSSSGHPQLDRATVDWAKSVTFTPAHAGAQAVDVCGYELAWKWEFKSFRSAESARRQFPWISTKGMTPPKLKEGIAPPVYPAEAQGKTGTTRMELCIDERGVPANVVAAHSSGTMGLDIAALRWVGSTARFEPAMLNGQPSGVCGFLLNQEWKRPPK